MKNILKLIPLFLLLVTMPAVKTNAQVLLGIVQATPNYITFANPGDSATVTVTVLGLEALGKLTSTMLEVRATANNPDQFWVSTTTLDLSDLGSVTSPMEINIKYMPTKPGPHFARYEIRGLNLLGVSVILAYVTVIGNYTGN